MPGYQLEDLRPEYENLFKAMEIANGYKEAANGIVDRIVRNRNVYETIMQATGVPWQVIGIIHSMEGSLDFTRHLHNGDPLTTRTVHKPVGHPVSGDPPFTFAESAIDALRYDGLAGLSDWRLEETLYRLERFNGFGYRGRDIHTPYLWSRSNHYKSGKFIEELKDGRYVSVFKPLLISAQTGAAILLKRMVDREILSFSGQPLVVDVIIDDHPKPAVGAFVQKGNSWLAVRPLAACIPGLSIAAINYNPMRITMAYLPPQAPEETPASTHDFEGRLYHDSGYVDATDLIRDFLGMAIEYDDTTQPNRLLISTA